MGSGFVKMARAQMERTQATLEKAPYQLTEARYWQEYGIQISWFGYFVRMIFVLVLFTGIFHMVPVILAAENSQILGITIALYAGVLYIAYTSSQKLLNALRGRLKAKRLGIFIGSLEKLPPA